MKFPQIATATVQESLEEFEYVKERLANVLAKTTSSIANVKNVSMDISISLQKTFWVAQVSLAL